jgi:hypothetical protein
MLDLTLQRFGGEMLRENSSYHLNKLLGCAAYSLLAGRRERCRELCSDALATHRSFCAGVLLLLSGMPVAFTRSLFALWRRGTV